MNKEERFFSFYAYLERKGKGHLNKPAYELSRSDILERAKEKKAHETWLSSEGIAV